MESVPSSAPVRVPAETFRVRLVAARLVTERVRELVFERVDHRFFVFQAGQWVSLVLPVNDAKGRPVRRSYSVSSVPNDSPRFELVVTKVDGGLGSTFLHDAPIGTELEVKGPQGSFTRASVDHPSLFIATGTGIAPFRGMVHEALRAGHRKPLTVLFGVRTVADALYRDELEQLARAHPNLTLHLSLSRPTPEWSGLTGYVQTHVASLWASLGDAPDRHAYICGVRKMLTEARDVLRTQLGVDRSFVHLESYD